MKIYIGNLFLFTGSDVRTPGKPNRAFQPPKTEREGHCRKPGCDGWLDRTRKNDTSYLECVECGAPHNLAGNLLDPGLDPSDIDNQGRTFSATQKGS